jgi:hypothetical protein
MPYNTSTPEKLEDARKQRRDWYYRNRQHVIDYQTIRQARVRKSIRKFLEKQKVESKCRICKMDHPACLQFHHIDKESKDVTISEAINYGWTIKRLKKELEKCEVLCANCHFILHWNERKE